MSDIFATLAAGTPRPTTAAGGEAAVRVIDPSPDLSRLASGENLRGTVVGKDDRGHLLVRTRLGVLTLAATRNLPVGSEVVLQVRSVGPQVLLNLLPLDSAAAPQNPVQGGQHAQAPLPAGGTPAQPSLPPNPHDLVQRGQLLRGVLHAAPPMPALTGLPTAQPGTELIVRILSLGVQAQIIPGAAANVPAAGGQPGAPLPSATVPGTAVPGAPVPGSLPQGTAATVAGSTGPGTSAAAPLPGGTAMPGSLLPGAAPVTPGGEAAPGLRLAPQVPVTNSGHSVATALQGLSAEAAARAAGSPGQPAASGSLGAGSLTGAVTTGAAGATPSGSAAGLGSLRLTGLVTAATSSGQPILHTPLGTITLNITGNAGGSAGATALPPGTSLALEIALPEATRPAAPPALAPAWPGLESLEDTLLHGLPAGQAEQVARALPQLGPRLASGVLFFLAALTQGNVAGWLAKAGIAGEAGERGDLAERLGRELAGLTRGVETASGDWRFVNLPIWSDQGLRELRCFFRHQGHGGKGQDGDGDKATRFVLELELQHHGELQLDGLVRARQFDLVLRSRHAFPALVRGDLLALFEEANAIAGYSGRLTFQSSTDWLQLMAARGASEPHEGFRV